MSLQATWRFATRNRVGFLAFYVAAGWMVQGSEAGTDDAKPQLSREATELEHKLDELRPPLSTPSNARSVDFWADADVFHKGVVWTLRYETNLEPKDVLLVTKALKRGKERAETLVAGKQPWATKQGRVVRGFVSTVDGSTQPYGLVIPTSYDPAKPIRLDVVLHGST